MLVYLAWLFLLWIRYLGGLGLIASIFGIAAGGALILVAAYAYGGRRARRNQRREAVMNRAEASAIRGWSRGARSPAPRASRVVRPPPARR
jgi:hypothetical protein